MIWYILAAVTLVLGLICLAIPLLCEVNRTLRNVLAFGGCAFMASSVCLLVAVIGV